MEHVDVLIVGAGLSGIGAGYHLQAECPGKSYAILEARGASGGTWDLFRYPGVRSDSDMFTLGYSFRPWTDAQAIADGPSILEYVRDTARENGIDRHIRFHHRVVGAEWSSDDSRWTVDVERTDTGDTVPMTCDFLYGCTGYYRYDEGYAPPFDGTERFHGTLVHPQHWPDDLHYAGKRVVVIGSGATAVTLVPAMAEDAAHVTMLQRSPSYVVTLPRKDPIARALRRVLPEKAAYAIVRWRNVLAASAFFKASRRWPDVTKRLIRWDVERRLPPGYDVGTHFTPSYEPWDQRVCFVPDGDLFDAISAGRASIVTDAIETFTERGLTLASGAELEADIVITATGLNMLPLGGVELLVDGARVELEEKVAYKGMMLDDVPNFAFAVGYTNASWTLKCDLTSAYVCRLLNHMDAHGYTSCTPRRTDPSAPTQPLIDLMSGYVLRALDRFPRQGLEPPWRLHQNYVMDLAMLKRAPLDDGAMQFAATVPARGPAEPLAA